MTRHELAASAERHKEQMQQMCRDLTATANSPYFCGRTLWLVTATETPVFSPRLQSPKSMPFGWKLMCALVSCILMLVGTGSTCPATITCATLPKLHKLLTLRPEYRKLIENSPKRFLSILVYYGRPKLSITPHHITMSDQTSHHIMSCCNMSDHISQQL